MINACIWSSRAITLVNWRLQRASCIDLEMKEVCHVTYKPEVDAEKCVGCGECVEICPVEIYELKDEKSVVVKEEECLGCESCVEVCEQKAITVSDV